MQILKELLAIVWGAKSFICVGSLWRQITNRSTPLFWKLTEWGWCWNSPWLCVAYCLRKTPVISDCLSRAPLSETEPVSEPDDVIGVNLFEEFGLEIDRKQHPGEIRWQLKYWRDIKSSDECFERMALWEYWNFREEAVENSKSFKSDRIVVSRPLKAEVCKFMELTWKRGKPFVLRGIIFSAWPSMIIQIKDTFSSCQVCNSFRNRQDRETLH